MVKQEVLRFQISVYDVQRVDVINSCNDLLEEFASFLLWYSCLLDDVVKEFSATCVLHNEVQLPGCFNYFVQLHYVRMPDEF